MATNNGDNSDNEVVIEVNNQMGETRIWEESTNETPTVLSEARGLREGDVRSEVQQTRTNIDIVTLLQQMTQQMTEKLTENNKQLEQKITENSQHS